MLEGILVQRVNRFLALVDLAGSLQRAFVANSGRLAELMLPGARVFFAPVSRPEGQTQLDLKLVDHCGVLVCVDTRTPNDLLHRALLAGSLPELQGYDSVRHEVTYDTCRFDFALDGPKVGLAFVLTAIGDVASGVAGHNREVKTTSTAAQMAEDAETCCPQGGSTAQNTERQTFAHSRPGRVVLEDQFLS